MARRFSSIKRAFSFSQDVDTKTIHLYFPIPTKVQASDVTIQLIDGDRTSIMILVQRDVLFSDWFVFKAKYIGSWVYTSTKASYIKENFTEVVLLLRFVLTT